MSIKNPDEITPGFEIGKKNMENKTELKTSYFDNSFVKRASFHFLERYFLKRKFSNLQRVFLLNVIYLYSFLLYIYLLRELYMSLNLLLSERYLMTFCKLLLHCIMQLCISYIYICTYLYVFECVYVRGKHSNSHSRVTFKVL